MLNDNAEARDDAADPLDAIELQEMLLVLGDPVRFKIVKGLARLGEANCTRLDLPVSKSTATHHFQVLRNAGVISTRNEGTARLSTLREREMERRFPGFLKAVLQQQD
ncbi:helix-turn-helix domain-containing protein [Breoghania sp.]|uniref:ArsR/SmtB family transcription factor n=1 Tax=Breoghania sp. TaxID=2065378 RepID=UPI00262A8C50|nr:helix-turn-helix domain-containing protein [Breoghania sp.]MDJ0930878.1 helix-turn-helix domain-containing protein [Breoghania sp.]